MLEYLGLNQMLSITVNDDLSSHTVNEDETLEFFFPPWNVLTTEPFASADDVEAFINANVKEYNWWQPYVEPAVRAQQQSDTLSAANRDTRNQLLSDSDWTQMTDSALTDEAKALWVTYRSALRDLTAHENWPNLEDADWPTKP
jgi:hypothetical protein